MLLVQQQEMQRMQDQMERLKRKDSKPIKPVVVTGGVRNGGSKLQDIDSSDSDSDTSSSEDEAEMKRRFQQREAREKRNRGTYSSSDEEDEAQANVPVMTIAERQRQKQREREQATGRGGAEEEKQETPTRVRSPSVFGGMRRKASALLRSPKAPGSGASGAGGSPLVNQSHESRARAMSGVHEGVRPRSSALSKGVPAVKQEEERDSTVEYENTMFRHGSSKALVQAAVVNADEHKTEGAGASAAAPAANPASEKSASEKSLSVAKRGSVAPRARKKSTSSKEQKQAAKMVSNRASDQLVWY
jgi:hypothetical protein